MSHKENDIEIFWKERQLESAKAKANYHYLVMKYTWKEDDEITCIDNVGKSNCLTVGKVYKVVKLYKDCGIYHVEVRGDNNEICTNLFCNRFTTQKLERLKKINKLNKYENFKKK